MTVASFGIAARLLGATISWDATFLAGPLIVLANCLPLTPGGIGMAEAASSGLFASVGTLCGAEMMLLVRLCTATLSLPGIAAIAMRRDRVPEAGDAQRLQTTIAPQTTRTQIKGQSGRTPVVASRNDAAVLDAPS
jgi:uncharacterized membrane protein YbhN (UPF0104 family)